MTILGLDADTVLTPYAPKIHAAAIEFACRYLKNLTVAEVKALAAENVAIVAIFETTAARALGGAAAGTEDGLRAWELMAPLGAPAGAVCYFAVDADVDDADIPSVIDYFVAAQEAAGGAEVGGVTVGAYGSGLVLSALRTQAGVTFLWLAGAMGWSGSRAFTGWSLWQGPTLAHGGWWNGIKWPDLGFPYDPDVADAEALSPGDIGAWLPVFPA
jgi:hypothetical protein